MRIFSRLWGTAYRSIITNASSMVGTTAVASALGFLYWWLAAHQFPPTAVGFASASISAMSLLGTIGALGLGTLLMGELSQQRSRAAGLIVTALLASGAAGSVLGLLFAIIAPNLSAEFQPLASSPASVALFATGVGCTTAGIVLDQALIGLLRGAIQFWRNVVFATVKLLGLFAVAIWLTDKTGLTIYVTWVIGNLVSLVGIAGFAALRGAGTRAWQLQPQLFRRLGGAAIGHHALNLALLAPNLVMPVLVTALLSATTNGIFYVAWMIAGFVFIGPLALSNVLYAASAAAPGALAHKLRFTLKLALVVGVLENIALLIGASQALRIFGPQYAEQAGLTLRIVGLGVFPLIVKDHYVAIRRVQRRIIGAVPLIAAGGLLELAGGALGAVVAGLPGLSLGWVVAACVEAAFMARAVYRAARPIEAPPTHPVDAEAHTMSQLFSITVSHSDERKIY